MSNEYTGIIPGFYKNNENLLNFDFINLQELIAKRASNQLWGNGFNLSSENPKVMALLDRLTKSNDLLSLFYSAEKVLSVWGVAIITIDISKEFIPILTIAQPYGQSRVARLNWDETQADTWTRMNQSDNSPYLHTTYTKDKIKREWVDENNTIMVQGETTKLFDKYQLEKEVKTNYGFIPVSFLQNLPKVNFFGDSNVGSYYPDNTAVQNLQNAIQETWKWLIHELRYNRTRFFGQLSQQELYNLSAFSQASKTQSAQIKNKNLLEQLISDAWIQTDLGIPGQSGSRTLEILVADPKFSPAISMLDWLISTYFVGCGYSKENEGSQQQTAFETTVKQSDDIETTRIKRTLRQRQYVKLLKKTLIGLIYYEAKKNKSEPDNDLIDDILNNNFSFEIKENNIIDRDKEISQQQQLLQLGLTTRLRAIQKIEGVSEQEAQEILDGIKQAEAEDQVLMDQALGQDGKTDEETVNENTETDS